ncbi:MAG: YncE family protein [Acidobacteria bacterium]|nr:YncE family protein [Acidobacteriota bacterium]
MRYAIAIGAVLAAVLWITPPAHAQQAAAGAAGLDFDYFRANVQPIFLAKRPGHARCVSCHIDGTPMRLQALSPGSATWNEEQSRKNFEVIRQRVAANNVTASKLLMHPLTPEAGGDLYHSGGKHWTSQSDPEWQALATWVKGSTGRAAAASPGKVRIIQTNSAGDNVSIIDPVSNKVVGEITGIEVGHGAAVSPDGTRIYVTNESTSTVDVADATTYRVMSKIPLSGHPNNFGITRDGGKLFISITGEKGGVDVVDTAAGRLAKTVPIKGGVHNTYVTPDGRYAVAGSIGGQTVNVIDTATNELVWSVNLGLGVRPMTFEANADGSTKRIYAQLSEFNGFSVIDFATRKEATRIKLPELAAGKRPVQVGGNVSHGMAVTADQKILIVNSRLNNTVYKYSLPDLKVVGSVEMTGGIDPNWVTLTPDGRTAYVAMSGSNWVSAIDIATMKESARIPVGFVPKRNITARLQ